MLKEIDVKEDQKGGSWIQLRVMWIAGVSVDNVRNRVKWRTRVADLK